MNQVTRRYAEYVASLLTLIAGRGVGVDITTVEEENLSPLSESTTRAANTSAEAASEPQSSTKQPTEQAKPLWLSTQVSKVIGDSLNMLRFEMTRLLTRLADSLGDTKQKHLFLINNYDLISSVLTVLCFYFFPSSAFLPQERKIHSEEILEYRTLLEHTSEEFINDQLGGFKCFQCVITFVKEIRALNGDEEKMKRHPLFNKGTLLHYLFL